MGITNTMQEIAKSGDLVVFSGRYQKRIRTTEHGDQDTVYIYEVRTDTELSSS